MILIQPFEVQDIVQFINVNHRWFGCIGVISNVEYIHNEDDYKYTVDVIETTHQVRQCVVKHTEQLLIKVGRTPLPTGKY